MAGPSSLSAHLLDKMHRQAPPRPPPPHTPATTQQYRATQSDFGWSPMHGTPFGSQASSMPHFSQWSVDKIGELQAKLDKRLGPEYISQRPGPGGGPKLTYIEGWKAINLANEVFGFNGWSSSISSLTVDFCDFNPDSHRYNVGVTAIVRVMLQDGAFHEDIGYGSLENAKQKGPALDKCKKEAVTDAIKRALRNFGNVLGNCLYDREYTKEVVKIKLPVPKFDKSTLHRRPEFAENGNAPVPVFNKPSAVVASISTSAAPTRTPVSNPRPLQQHVHKPSPLSRDNRPTTADMFGPEEDDEVWANVELGALGADGDGGGDASIAETEGDVSMKESSITQQQQPPPQQRPNPQPRPPPPQFRPGPAQQRPAPPQNRPPPPQQSRPPGAAAARPPQPQQQPRNAAQIQHPSRPGSSPPSRDAQSSSGGSGGAGGGPRAMQRSAPPQQQQQQQQAQAAPPPSSIGGFHFPPGVNAAAPHSKPPPPTANPGAAARAAALAAATAASPSVNPLPQLNRPSHGPMQRATSDGAFAFGADASKPDEGGFMPARGVKRPGMGENSHDETAAPPGMALNLNRLQQMAQPGLRQHSPLRAPLSELDVEGGHVKRARLDGGVGGLEDGHGG